MAGDRGPLEILDGLLARVKKAGGDAADAGLFKSISLEVAQRLGAAEKLERSESTDAGLRVFIGQRQAIVSSTDLSDDALDAMVERAIAMAKVAPEDPYCGIADADQIITDVPALDIFDPTEPDTQSLIDIAIEADRYRHRSRGCGARGARCHQFGRRPGRLEPRQCGHGRYQRAS
jgi:PmbA protein